ncbi:MULTISPECIES: VWA domain-containing protein [unclassified Microbacterium]|uniref:vWA domain-containing protein n=1 Tax=unclassified Microbacterium TaxID=2609290 RepID=UPI001E52A30D|nr:VWA domain-containing protein [Microbacterium sp. MAH-37]
MPETPLPPRRSTHIEFDPATGDAVVPAKPITHEPQLRPRPRPQVPASGPLPRSAAVGAAARTSEAEEPASGLRTRPASGVPTRPLLQVDGGAGDGTTPPADAADAPPPKRRRTVLIAMVAVITVLLGSLAAVTAGIASSMSDRDAEAAAPPAAVAKEPAPIEFPKDTPAAAAGAGPCTSVRVLSSFENAEMVENLANAYNEQPRDVDGSCVTVTTSKSKSGTAAEDAADSFSRFAADQRPTVWLPDSSMWLADAGDAAPVGERTLVAFSDVVPAMPHSLADAIGWSDKAPTWAEIFTAAGDPDVWADAGHPDWGTFKLGKTSPLVATSGAAAMLASYGVAADDVGEVTTADIADPTVRRKVHDQELATSHYMATPEHFLWHARQAEAKGSSADYLSAVIVDEKSIWDYNRGITSRDGVTRSVGQPPVDPLVPIYPADGAYSADNPAIPLTGDWVDAKQQAAAADFIRFSGTQEGQTVVREAGYRDLNRELDDHVAQIAQLDKKGATTQLSTSADVLLAAQKAFPEVRKRANVLFLLDVSGSMDEPVTATDTRLTLAKKAVSAALDHFTEGDDVGLAAFAQDPDGKLVPGQLTPVADIRQTGKNFVSRLNSITSMGDTPLYEAVDTFAKKQAASWANDHINAIVLLSDGENDTNHDTTTAAQMLSTLEGLHHDNTPVLIFTLAYGKDADVQALKDISGATGAHYYDATDPTQLKEVLGDLVTSF